MRLMKRKGQIPIEMPAVPWIFVAMLLFIVAFAIIVYLKVTSTVYADKSNTASYALYTILNANDCTPETKIPFKEVIAAGIAQQKYSATDKILLDYGGKKEDVSILSCLNPNVREQYRFYIDYSGCPQGGCYIYDSRAFGGAVTKAAVSLNIESSEYIALPSGDVARAVLKTR